MRLYNAPLVKFSKACVQARARLPAPGRESSTATAGTRRCTVRTRLKQKPFLFHTPPWCAQSVNGNRWYLSARIGYPCFGAPRRQPDGKITGYAAYGR